MSIHVDMQVLHCLPRAWRLMLLTFSSAVSVYQVGQTGTCPTADVVSGHWQPAAATKGKHQQQQHADLPIRSPEPLHIAALQSCQETAEQIIDCWRWALACTKNQS